MTEAALTIHFSPILPMGGFYALCAALLLLLLISFVFYRRGILWRLICAAAFLAVFAGPSLTEEKRESTPDVAVIVVDRSPSQQNGERIARTETALQSLQAQLGRYGDRLDLRVIDAPAGIDRLARETRLFDVIDQAFADVPESRRAGVILLTDGQIHDVPLSDERMKAYGPVNGLISGSKEDMDRQLVITEAPSYGIVGQSVTIRYRIEDANSGDEDASVIIRQDNQPARAELVPVGEEQTLRVTIDHAGQNVVDLEASPLEGEISEANNRAPVIINGVRDRLRVLLVSGQPHAGGRTWRDILTSDPGVDLVHFTILREPDKLDATPQNELSLIAFPFRELFEIKLYDFNLIIFDRYKLNRILPNYYFANIAQYVKEGGALLEASGPAFAGTDSVFTTALKDVLPGYPTGQIIDRPYKPAVTDLGNRHPVTENLTWRGGEWGSWLRQVAVQPTGGGNVLMTGAEKQPLLILNRVGKGRIAQLASDQIWLWARGYDGGGPQAELLRRLAHWLMKEPELEENALDIKTDGSTMIIRRRSLEDTPIAVTVTSPKGVRSKIELAPDGDGGLQARFEADELGIYVVNDGTQERFAIVGDINPPELRGIVATEDKLKPATLASGGNMLWLEDTPEPSVRMQSLAPRYGGRGWIGLRENRSYTVTGVTDKPFMPAWVYALGLLTLAVAAWWFEGRPARKKKA